MTADLALIVLGVVALAEIGERAWFWHSVAPRLRVTGEQRPAVPKTAPEEKAEPDDGVAKLPERGAA